MNNIKVISLQRSTSRREQFASRNHHVPYAFVDAVDGHALTDQEIAGSGLFHPGLPYTRGAYGCALSHLRLWDEAIETGQPVTIAEDDAIFRHDFVEQYRAALDCLPPDWDFILWGWNLDYVLSFSFMPGISPAVAYFDQDQMRKSIREFQAFDEKPNFLRLDKCWGIPAYTISPAGARKFKEQCVPLVSFDMFVPITKEKLTNTGIDSAMNRVYHGTNSFVSFPPLVVTENDHAISTIQVRKQKSLLSRKFHGFKQAARGLFGGAQKTT
jgi:GR25 family glycosyltransferase involved in LPS biosynthesis